MDALMEIYLQDHRAGAEAGVRLVRRTLGSNRNTEFEPELTDVAAMTEEDLETLEEVMAAMSVEKSRPKQAAAVVAEMAGRLKPNHRIVGYSPLSRVLEFEALTAGLGGRLRLWAALEVADSPELKSFDFADLRQRGARQLELVANLHRRASEVAFG